MSPRHGARQFPGRDAGRWDFGSFLVGLRGSVLRGSGLRGSGLRGSGLRGSGLRGSAAALLVAAVSIGCTTPKPVTRFYSLMPTFDTVDAAGRGAAVPAAPSRFFEVLPVTLPLQDDQPQLVTEQPDGSFAVLEQQRWLGPLKSEIRDALSYRLSQRFAEAMAPVGTGAAGGAGAGAGAGAGGTGAGSATGTGPVSGVRAVWRIGVEVQRFDSAPGRYARLDAAWTVRSPTDATTTLICRNVFEERAANDYPALVQAHRAAVGRLADTIADTIFKVQSGGMSVCP
jgi:uncharacterized lipoprotein YmbA